MSYYRRHLPHWQPEGAIYFVTFRLAGSLPLTAIEALKQKRNMLLKGLNQDSDISEIYSPFVSTADRKSHLQLYVERKIFQAYDDLLDYRHGGSFWLSKPDIAELVKEAIEHRDQTTYNLYAYCIMPNHVHMVLKLADRERDNDETRYYPLTKVLQGLKSFTALKANRKLHRKGTFWQSESFDHVIRDSKELEQSISYVLNNPVKAGLVKKWKDWPYIYCYPDFESDFDYP